MTTVEYMQENEEYDKENVDVEQGDYVKLDSYDKAWYRYVKQKGLKRTLVSASDGNVWNGSKAISENFTNVAAIEEEFGLKVLAVARSKDTRLQIDKAQEL